jgi:hypothetical protein
MTAAMQDNERMMIRRKLKRRNLLRTRLAQVALKAGMLKKMILTC